MPDLITSDYAEDFLAAAGVELSAAQTAILPSLIASASDTVRRICNRNFDRRTYTREYEADGMPIMLDEFPVNGILRAAWNRSTVLSISADRSQNQRATVRFTSTGDENAGLVFTGLAFSRVSYGTTSTNSLTFTSYPTLSALAGAIQSLAGGWSVNLAGGFENWPSSELIGGDAAQGAVTQPAEFQVYSEDLAGYRLADRGTGQVLVPVRGTVQFTYDAGFDTIPAALQEAVAEVLKYTLDRSQADATLSGEVLKSYQWTAAQVQSAVPQSTWSTLMRFKRW